MIANDENVEQIEQQQEIVDDTGKTATTTAGGGARQQSKKPSTRPAMQIYRPPGEKRSQRPGEGGSSSGSSPTGGTTVPATVITGSATGKDNNNSNKNQAKAAKKPTTAAGSKQPSTNNKQMNSAERREQQHRGSEDNNNMKCGATADSTGSRASSRSSQNTSERCTDGLRLARTESSLSSESAVSQKSLGSNGIGNGKEPKEFIPERKPKQVTPPRKEVKKKVMGDREIDDTSAALRNLNIGNCAFEVEQWITGGFTSEELAETLGSAISQHAIENGMGRAVAKLCGSLKDAESINSLCRGLWTSISQYYECRDRLRTDHFRMWISFLSFVSDIYANVGGGADGEIADVVFQIFHYLLRPPILDNLKIEELECLISTLLSIGYELERECPEQLTLLKDLVRDAFIEVTEPWARKMILLLLELGASGWKLPAEANEYYFQQASGQ